MSHIATNYVRNLPELPEGASIKGTKYAVLWAIAHSHNDATGSAWPSMKEIAKRCNINERYCRSIVRDLERIGILARVAMRNGRHGGQSSNAYIFPALGKPESPAKLVQILNQVARVPRFPMPVSPRAASPRPSDECDRGGGASNSGTPGYAVPAIESLGEHSCDTKGELLRDSSHKTLTPKPKKGAVQGESNQKPGPMKGKTAFGDLQLGQSAWDNAVDNLRKTLFAHSAMRREQPSDFVSGEKDWKFFRFEKVSVLSVVELGSRALLMTVKSPCPKATARGLRMHQKQLEQSLRKFYGYDTRLKLKSGK